jgi:hypothetical protein
MKRLVAFLSLFVIALLVASATPSDAWRGGGAGYRGGGGGYRGGHGRVYVRPFVGVAPGFWWGRPYGYWGYGWPYYGAPYYPAAPYYSSTVVVQPPPSYETAPSSAEAPAQAQEPQAYWYYCASAGAYYPTAPSCPEVWIKVPPRSE